MSRSLSSGGSIPSPDRVSLAFVLLVWLGMLAWALAFIAAFAPAFPVGDEIALWILLPPRGSLSWEGLWRLHNEHRIPLPRLVHYLAYVLTGDLRTAMVVQALLLGGIALGMVALVRRIRGSTTWTDVLFPILWLNVGNWTNLLSGFQVSLTLPALFVCAILAGIAVSPERVRTWRAVAIGGALVCLPLCGAVGVIQVPALAAWCVWQGWSSRCSADPEERRGSRILLAGVLVCAAICGFYAWQYEPPRWYHYTASPAAILKLCGALFSLALGPAGETWWPWSAAFVVLAVAATLALLAAGPAGRAGTAPNAGMGRAELRRQIGLVAWLAATLCLIASIGVGRADLGWRQGFVARYVTLSAPLLCGTYLAWTLYGGRKLGAIAVGSMAVVTCAALPANVRIGTREGKDIRDRVERFEALVARGPSAVELVHAYMESFPPYLHEASRTILQALAAEHKRPFDRGPAPSTRAFEFLGFTRLPSQVESADATASRYIEGHHVLVVSSGTKIHLDLLPGEGRISGRFGIPPELVRSKKSGGVRFRVEAVRGIGAPQILLDRVLDPVSAESDRGGQAFELEVSAQAPAEIILTTEKTADSPRQRSEAYWSDVRIE